MNFPRRRVLHLAASAVAVATVSRTARGQAYPTQEDIAAVMTTKLTMFLDGLGGAQKQAHANGTADGNKLDMPALQTAREFRLIGSLYLAKTRSRHSGGSLLSSGLVSAPEMAIEVIAELDRSRAMTTRCASGCSGLSSPGFSRMSRPPRRCVLKSSQSPLIGWSGRAPTPPAISSTPASAG